MPMKFRDRLAHAWNLFTSRDPDLIPTHDLGPSSYDRPDRHYLNRQGEQQTIIASIYNRISVDVCQTTIQHVRTDKNGGYIETMNSGLNECLTLSANIDQTAKQFIQDLVISMLDEGVVAVVPTETNVNLRTKNSFDILSMRVGQITDWYPENVKIRVYNEKSGQKEDVTLEKSKVCIIENPFYTIMNGPNSTLKRLISKLALLDKVDNESNSGKLDMLIQLPYTIKTEKRREQAEQRRKDIENQLSETKYGIAYIDSTERVTQLNRAIENNLLPQIEYLTNRLYTELGLTPEIFSGTATPDQMNNYISRTVEPIAAAIVDEMKRKFLTKTARTQNQTIMYFREPFKFVSIDTFADMADRLIRNEIVTANEIRQQIGLKTSQDPNSDVLRNKNITDPNPSAPVTVDGEPVDLGGEESYPGEEADIDALVAEVAEEEGLTDEEVEALYDELEQSKWDQDEEDELV